jgi:hypothetical protein
MGSCLGARRRKFLRSVLLKLFSRDLAFIVISYSNASVPCGQSLRCSGGILKCLFRGRNKSDNVTGWGYILFLSRRARSIAARYFHELRFESVR